MLFGCAFFVNIRVFSANFVQFNVGGGPKSVRNPDGSPPTNSANCLTSRLPLKEPYSRPARESIPEDRLYHSDPRGIGLKSCSGGLRKCRRGEYAAVGVRIRLRPRSAGFAPPSASPASWSDHSVSSHASCDRPRDARTFSHSELNCGLEFEPAL